MLFENKLKTANMRILLSEAELEVKKGLTRPARSFLKEFKQGAKVS
jgi:hypothetical protein